MPIRKVLQIDRILQRVPFLCAIALAACPAAQFLTAQPGESASLIQLGPAASRGMFLLADSRRAADIIVDPQNPEAVRLVAEAFAEDIQRVTASRPHVITRLDPHTSSNAVVVGVLHHSPTLDQLVTAKCIDPAAIERRWESAIIQVVSVCGKHSHPILVVAGSDRRGAAFALFSLSRQIGVSPWNWWADVPVAHRSAIFVAPERYVQSEPSILYRGIFLNDEDWGLRPWAAKNIDPALRNIGPHTYERIFELLLRLRANTLWPAMHPGTLAFNAIPQNAVLADRWGIVMSSSHSEALLRNNVGEWDEKRDGPWNYQLNRAAIDAYWDERLKTNGGFENFYTVGMRGIHDTGLEAIGTAEQKARLLEQVMQSQRNLLRARVDANITAVPQVIWLYKESLELYRAGMKVPDDVTLGWTDDNYGYIRQLPNAAEQHRSGGSGVYYHVSYWGFPHDYLWLCSTPPSLIREEMTKAYDHDATRFWVLNVGDIKPAEADIDYFMQLAWNVPAISQLDQPTFLLRWAAEQFPASIAPRIAHLLNRYDELVSCPG
jgi:hypothetical protein